MPARPRRRLDEIEAAQEKAMKLYAKGMSGQQIAQKVGYSKSAVNRWINRTKLGQPLRVVDRRVTAVRMAHLGMTNKYIADRMGVDPSTVSHWLNGRVHGRLNYHKCNRMPLYPNGFYEGLNVKGWGYA